MSVYFNRQIELKLMQKSAPVLFVHKRSFDTPEGFSLHLNDCVEVYVYVSGETDYIIEENYHTLRPGDIMVISPHEVHVPVLKSPCEYERIYLLFPLDTFADYRFDPLLPFVTRQKGASARLALSAQEKDKALDILHQISALCKADPSPGDQLTAWGLTTQFLGLLSPISQTCGDEEPSGIPVLLRQILQFISISPQELKSVGDIAKHFHISPPYLSALFKKHVGVTASSYLRIKKIALAKKLLEAGNSVAYTCYECGFSDSSHFIKNFKNFTGITPYHYNEIHTKKR